MCTSIRFTDNSGHMYLGRNLDWSFGYGEKVRITPKGFPIPYSFIDDAPAAHAVIGMCIDYENYPMYFDCGNDAGLAVAGLNFPGYAEYAPSAQEGKTSIAAYEFPLWVATTFSTVDEVEAALANTEIVAKSAGEGLGVSLLHWIIGDAKRSIVVEMMADGLHVYDDPVDTLANQPTFPWHLENLRTYITASSDFPQAATWRGAELTPYGAGAGMRGIPGDCYSTSRFVKAAYLNANYPQKDTEAENVIRMFRSLEGVGMVEGASKMGDGSFEKTVYTGCFSGRTGTYYYSTYEDPAIRFVSLADAEGADPTKLVCPEPRRN